jgi:hypothetical protein
MKLTPKYPFAFYFAFQILLFLLLFVLPACHRNIDLSSAADVLEITDSDIVGLWRIDRFIDGGIDETAEFSGIFVSFELGNKMLIFKNNKLIYEGFWRIRLNKNELAINLFNAIDPYDEWNGDWYVTKKDSNTLWILNGTSLEKEEFRMSK